MNIRIERKIIIERYGQYIVFLSGMMSILLRDRKIVNIWEKLKKHLQKKVKYVYNISDRRAVTTSGRW